MNTQQQPTMMSFDDLFTEGTGASVEENTLTPPQEPVELIIDNPTPTPTPPVVEEPLVPVSKTSYSNKIGTLLETGLVGNFEITVGDEKVFLSDLEINDEETFNELLSQIKTEQEKNLQSKYISKEGLDETTQKLIEIRKAGGDITDVIKENVRAIDLLTSYKEVLEVGDDKEKEDLSISILAQELRNKGLEDEIIQAQIQVYINKGELEDRASNVLNSHLSLHSQEIENKRVKETERQQQEKEDLKNYKKTLNQKYKDLGLPENTQKLLVDNATKMNQYNVSNTDELYFNLRASKEQKDIETFAKLNYFIHNPEEFEKWISGKKVTQAKTAEILKSTITINTNKIKPFDKSQAGSFDDLFSE